LKSISKVSLRRVVDLNLAVVAVPGHPAGEPRAGGRDEPGKFVFAQVMEHLPMHVFHRCVVRYSGEHKVKWFSCLDQYFCMAFAPLTFAQPIDFAARYRRPCC
jgi:hypothetical protein